jgi:cyclic-di-AMP phosphodiesterase PgpH
MPNAKDKPPSRIDYRKLVILLLLALALATIISIGNSYFNEEYQPGDIARENVKSPADISIPESDITIKKGEIIVREGERINEEHRKKLSAVHAFAKQEKFTVKKFLSFFVLLFLLLAIIIEYAEKNIKKFTLSVKDLLFGATFTIFSVLLVKTCSLVFEYYAPSHIEQLFYVIPIFLFGIVFRIVLFSEAAIIFSAIFSIVLGFTFGNSLAIFLYAFVGNILASYFSGKCENRNVILKAGVYTAIVMGFLSIIFDIFLQHTLGNISIRFGFLLLSGVASSFIALGILPVIESVFDYTTDIKLLELANLENPLLEDMMLNAPGTYHHSIVVGNLAKAAAESIGAHPLLTRVAAYYHDIGKLKMPHYYIENRVGTEDAHEDLTPNMSALIILSHTKEGVELAQEHKIGTKITEIIKQHHGTSLVSYFYSKAKEQEDPDLHVIEEKDYRYTGPKPQTKETGIIMLADAVEAASRTLEDPTPKRIETHVQNVIENIFLDGQLDECELTLKDLHAIQKSFITIFIGIFHQRIEYPERTTNGGTDKKLTKSAEDRRKEHQKGHRSLAKLFGVSK